MKHRIRSRVKENMKSTLSDKRRAASLIVVVLLVGAVGLALQLLTNAATLTVTMEPETGTLSEGAQSVTDSTASGGKAIVFNPPVAPPTEVALVDTNFDAFPVSSPMSLANFRTAMNDPVINGNLSFASVNSEAGRGNYMRVTIPANGVGGGYGMSSTPILKQAVDEASIQYDVRFAGAFDWSKGGKLPGLGGFVPGTTDSASACVAGSSQTWSGRAMWGGGGNWIGYMYNKFKLATELCGVGIQTGKYFVANKWHTVKQYYKMNSVGADGTVNADGVHKMWLDGTLVVDNPKYRYRDNTKLHVTHMFWSIFRGGSDSTWASPTPGPIDIDNLVVKTPS